MNDFRETVLFCVTMRTYLIILFAIVTASNGAKWNDFRGGELSMPVYLEKHERLGFGFDLIDYDNLKIKWYSKHKNDLLSVAYDELGNCAGVRVTIYERDIDPKYLPLYKKPNGIFEKIVYKSVPAYQSVVMFTPERYQKGGKELKRKGNGELGYSAYLKEDGKYRMLTRKTCTQANRGYVDQGCHSKYGLILSHFGSKSECSDLTPFYTVHNLKDGGDLIGFGWLFFNKESKKDTFLQHITPGRAKELFPESHPCLQSSSNLAVGDIWLSYTEGQKVSCPSSSWVDKNCKKKRSSSEDSSDSGSKEKSFFSKWFG